MIILPQIVWYLPAEQEPITAVLELMKFWPEDMLERLACFNGDIVAMNELFSHDGSRLKFIRIPPAYFCLGICRSEKRVDLLDYQITVGKMSCYNVVTLEKAPNMVDVYSAWIADPSFAAQPVYYHDDFFVTCKLIDYFVPIDDIEMPCHEEGCRNSRTLGVSDMLRLRYVIVEILDILEAWEVLECEKIEAVFHTKRFDAFRLIDKRWELRSRLESLSCEGANAKRLQELNGEVRAICGVDFWDFLDVR